MSRISFLSRRALRVNKPININSQIKRVDSVLSFQVLQFF